MPNPQTVASNASDSNAQQRVSVSLKNLIELAKPAAALDLRRSRISAAQSGAYLSHFKGRGMAFAETRLYQPGDDVRRIDWRVTARTGKTHSKIFNEDRERPLLISVDYRATMSFATRGLFKSVLAARLAGLLAWSALYQGDRIGGQIFSDNGCQELKPLSGKAAMLHFFQALTTPRYHALGDLCLDKVLARLQQHARPGSRVIIISDFRGLNSAAEHHLAQLGRHCDVILLHIADPLEMQLPLKGRYRFTDNVRELFFDGSDNKLKQEYQQRYQQRRQRLQQLCRRFNLTWLSCATTDQPVDIVQALM